METKANYVVTGLFTLAVIFGVFGFVYWVQSIGGGGEQALYRIVFAGSVSGLRTGAAVLFDGMRVGEVTQLTLDAQDPRKVEAVISVQRSVPVRADTKVTLEFQGLTGLAQIALAGGAPDAATVVADGGGPPTLYADPNAGADVTQAARSVLSRIDNLVSANELALQVSVHNIQTMTTALAVDLERLDKIMSGVENLMGTGDNPGAIAETVGSIRKLADDLDKRTGEISVGLTRFSNTGLKEFEGLATDGRKTLAEINKAIKNSRRAPVAADLRALSP